MSNVRFSTVRNDYLTVDETVDWRPVLGFAMGQGRGQHTACLETRPNQELPNKLGLFHRGEISDNSVVEVHIDDGRGLIDTVEGLHLAGPVDKPVAGIWKRTQDDGLPIMIPKHAFSRDGYGTALCAADSQAPLRCRGCARRLETETCRYYECD